MVASACGKVTTRGAAKQQFSPVADVNGSFYHELRIAFPSDIFRLRDIICISIELSGIVSPPLISYCRLIFFRSLEKRATINRS